MGKQIVLGEGYPKFENTTDLGDENVVGLGVVQNHELCRTFQKRMKLVKKGQPYRLVLLPLNKKAYDKKTRAELDAD